MLHGKKDTWKVAVINKDLQGRPLLDGDLEHHQEVVRDRVA